jgi:membrane-associated phospholipid phosphatase
MGRLQGWLIAFVGMALVVAASYAFVDRPVAFYAHAHLTQYGVFDALTRISDYLAVAAVIVFVVAGLRSLVTAHWERWQGTLLLCAISLTAAESVKDEVKFIFGRTWPETWVNNNPSLIGNGTFGFNFFHGGAGYASFPSGHTTAVCAVVAVLWFAYPRLRPLWALAVLAVVIGLIGADYHFVSDIIGGSFLGVSAGWMTLLIADSIALPRLSGRGTRPPPAS